MCGYSDRVSELLFSGDILSLLFFFVLHSSVGNLTIYLSFLLLEEAQGNPSRKPPLGAASKPQQKLFWGGEPGIPVSYNDLAP
jgi:hypothetical protein